MVGFWLLLNMWEVDNGSGCPLFSIGYWEEKEEEL